MSLICNFCETKFQDATEVKIHMEECKKKSNKTVKFWKKFINGLEEMGLTYEEVKTYICVGGVHLKERGMTLSYEKKSYRYKRFSDYFPNDILPEYKDICVCGHEIHENCFIIKPESKNVNEIIIVGNCCVKRFIDNGLSQICEICKSKHKARDSKRCVKHKHDCQLCKEPNAKYGKCLKCHGTCEICYLPHKNKLLNRCNDHKKSCIYCKIEHNCNLCNKIFECNIKDSNINECKECQINPNHECSECHSQCSKKFSKCAICMNKVIKICNSCDRKFIDTKDSNVNECKDCQINPNHECFECKTLCLKKLKKCSSCFSKVFKTCKSCDKVFRDTKDSSVNECKECQINPKHECLECRKLCLKKFKLCYTCNLLPKKECNACLKTFRFCGNILCKECQINPNHECSECNSQCSKKFKKCCSCSGKVFKRCECCDKEFRDTKDILICSECQINPNHECSECRELCLKKYKICDTCKLLPKKECNACLKTFRFYGNILCKECQINPMHSCSECQNTCYKKHNLCDFCKTKTYRICIDCNKLFKGHANMIICKKCKDLYKN